MIYLYCRNLLPDIFSLYDICWTLSRRHVLHFKQELHTNTSVGMVMSTRVGRYQMCNQSSYIEEEQTTQWSTLYDICWTLSRRHVLHFKQELHTIPENLNSPPILFVW
jgi:hypothetical protein